MSIFTTIPLIIWKTLSLRFDDTDTQLGPTVKFMGTKWRLVLTHVREVQCGNTFRLTFEKLNLVYHSPDIYFDIHTGVESDGKKGLTFNTTSSLEYNVWYLWSEKMANVYKTFNITDIDSIIFWIIIKPRLGSRVLCESDGIVEGDLSDCVVNLTQDIGKFYDVKEHSDVVLICGDRSIPAHKVILSARSNYFAKLFKDRMNESEENVVHMKNTEPGTLEELVYYLYSGEISDFKIRSIRKLYALADLCAVEALKIKCALSVMNSYSRMMDSDVNTSFDSLVSLPESMELLEDGKMNEFGVGDRVSKSEGETTDGTSEFGGDTASGNQFAGDNGESGQLGGDKVEGSQLERVNAGLSEMKEDKERNQIGGGDDVVSEMEYTCAKDKQLLTHLFRSREWQTLSIENPKLAHDMCKSLFFKRDV